MTSESRTWGNISASPGYFPLLRLHELIDIKLFYKL